jgi:hypothetical protein
MTYAEAIASLEKIVSQLKPLEDQQLSNKGEQLLTVILCRMVELEAKLLIDANELES